MSNGRELRIPPGVTLQVSKGLAQLDLVAKQCGRTLLAPAQRHVYQHDFEVMLTFRNLERIGVECFSRGTMVVDFWVWFDPVSSKVIDSAKGVEAPVVPRGLVDEHRVLMVERDKNAAALYRHFLDSPWTTAESRPAAAGESFVSEHAAAITGQTCSGRFFVANSLRHSGRVYEVSPRRDWAKAWDDQEMCSVFCHVKFCDNGLVFTRNDRVSYQLISTPRGLQGRHIRAVA